jgi:hypothetical protein
MTRWSSKPRYIKPETICIGDTIRVTRKHKDAEISVVGKVAFRRVFNHSTEYQTEQEQVLLEHFRYTPQKLTVTLLDRPSDHTPTLPGMEL